MSADRRTSSASLKLPIRTCVGCRQRSSITELLRVVAVKGVIIPDPRRQLPGRGASVHYSRACLDLAERRRAFSRALRISGSPEIAPVREYVSAVVQSHDLDVRAMKP